MGKACRNSWLHSKDAGGFEVLGPRVGRWDCVDSVEYPSMKVMQADGQRVQRSPIHYRGKNQEKIIGIFPEHF